MIDLWQFQIILTRRLGLWSVGSILLGLGMLTFGAPFWNGLAYQFIGWGLIDLLIAWGGASATRRRRARLTEVQAIASIPQETRKLRRILWINTGLDVLYMLGGTLTAIFLRSHPFWLGSGLGILIQGTFLFFFDWMHARQLREEAMQLG